jgi:hypothetical protein
MTDSTPCALAAYHGYGWQWDLTCNDCMNWAVRFGGGKCLGPDGYRWMALVASEVAAEREEKIGSLRRGLAREKRKPRAYSKTGP